MAEQTNILNESASPPAEKPPIMQSVETIEELGRKFKGEVTFPGDTHSKILSITELVSIRGYEAYRPAGNAAMQAIGRIASQSPEYQQEIHRILKETYPSGYIKIYRGTSTSGLEAFEREFINVTSDRVVAVGYEQMMTPFATLPPPTLQIDGLLIKVEDVVSVGSLEESEFILPVTILKDRITHPIVFPVMKTVAPQKKTAPTKSVIKLE